MKALVICLIASAAVAADTYDPADLKPLPPGKYDVLLQVNYTNLNKATTAQFKLYPGGSLTGPMDFIDGDGTVLLHLAKGETWPEPWYERLFHRSN
jgi:hypothetical protein